MRIAILSLTRNGAALAEKLKTTLGGAHACDAYTFEKYPFQGAESFCSLSELAARLFDGYDAFVFFSACGIAVRVLAPHIRLKTSDPAVVVVDEQGRFAISLLSGHVGGANSLTQTIAAALGAVPVITTATDIGGKFSPDSFAKANSLVMREPQLAKKIAAAIVDGETVGFQSDYPYTALPFPLVAEERSPLGILVSSSREESPFLETLHLIPKNLVLGVGCKKGVPPDVFENRIFDCLRRHGIPFERVSELATIDIKKEEPAICSFCEKYRLPMQTYSAQRLMEVEGVFSVSEFVRKTTGADNVCERSAMVNGARLLLTKQPGKGVTAAVAEKALTLDFERRIAL